MLIAKAKTKKVGILKIMGWRQVAACALCCLLFLGMLLLNLRELMQLGNENAYRNCQNSYLLASREIDEYLHTADEAVESAARRIEEMRVSGATSEEILAYMVRETENMDKRIAGADTGVYGYIDGVYLDGTGWTPEPGYVPTSRPWYAGARRAGGSIAHVSPFDNLQTGLTTITICKLLSDGVSVVAIDFPMEKLQQIITGLMESDANVDGGSSPYEYARIFVMDINGVIVAHSDESELLKNYILSGDPVARETAQQIMLYNRTFFQIEDGSHSMIYYCGKLDDWFVFSGLEYGQVVSRITRNLVISIAVAIIGIAGLIVVMVSLSLRRYHEQVIRDYATEVEEENQKLEEKAAAALKIAELTQSVSALLANMPGIMSSKDAATGKYLACNQAFAEFVGRERPEDVIGLTNRDIFSEEAAEIFASDDEMALSMDQPYSFYEETHDAVGNPRQFQTTKLKFTDTAGRLCTLCMRLDYTELMRAKQETAEVQAAFEKARSISEIYAHMARAFSENCSQIYYVDLMTEWYASYSSGEEQGDVTSEAQGEDFFYTSRENAKTMIYPEDHETFFREFTKENVLRAIEERGEFTMNYRLMMDDTPVFTSLKATLAPGDERHLIIDVSIGGAESDKSELTGLYKEAAFFIHGKELLQKHPEGWCVLAMDLEHFKLFNEWYGREMGDQLLVQIGDRLSLVEKNFDGLAGYMGQDDFALIVPYDEKKIKELFDAIHGFVVEFGTSVGFMPAFGVCMADGGSSVEELYDRASQASRHAKEDYHHRIRVFEEAMYKKTEQDYQILSDFQQALQNHELFIQLQPQCLIDTGKVVGAESLVRWKKADGTMVSPGIFVPVLEQYGFVSDLDQFVWEEVCAWQKKWIDDGHTPLPISVNVSQIDIFTIDVPSFFDLLLRRYNLPVEVIKIEITESAYVGDGAVAETVRRLREKGFLVLMDDFGSGYSSLNMLRSLNVDIIKLDAKFLRMNSDDRKGVQILESIVNMAKSMEAPIIVEGVETEEETAFIKSLGCRYVQGYHFYKPMPVPDFEALIGDEGNIDTGGFVL